MFIGQNFHVAISSTNVTKAGLLYQLTFTYVQSINDNASGLSAMVWSPNQGLWNLLAQISIDQMSIFVFSQGKFVFSIFTLITNCTRHFSQYHVCCAY